MKEVAHTVRKTGNWGAHPQDDPLRDVTLEDAVELLKFTSEYHDEVFVRPARLDALRKKKGIKWNPLARVASPTGLIAHGISVINRQKDPVLNLEFYPAYSIVS